VVLVYRSPDGVQNVAVPGITLEAGDGGRLRFLSVQGWGDATVGLAHQRLRLGRDATGRVGEVGLGGRLARLDLEVELEGAGSSTEVVGLYFGEREQTLDYRMVINHIGRNTSSDVFLKGAVEDDAQSIFTGLLRIEKDALRSSAFETNRNLVLSENAKAHSVPNLEILCDDVVCGHGSSVGPLEEEHLYYLQSRGISRARAERMLVRGFFTEVIDRLPVDVVTEPLQQAVFRRFVAGPGGGSDHVSWVRVVEARRVPQGAGLRVEIGEHRIALFRIGSDVYAIGDRCSHAEASLAEGDVFDTEVECPRHGSAFDLETGEPHALPATKPVPVYDVKVEDDVVYLRVDEGEGT
jgi:nitrite reductase/ring-hydroxylating ferredoxin subunit